MSWVPGEGTDRQGRPRPAPQHGTRSGYNKHRKQGEAACEACTLAEREYQREHKRQWYRNRAKAKRSAT